MYEVGWIGQDNAVGKTSVVQANDLVIRKKAHASRSMLKIYIRESVSQNSPWIIHANLAKKYGIPTEPPKDLLNGQGLPKLRRRLENGTTDDGRKNLKKGEPIDDILLKPTADDLSLSKRASTVYRFQSACRFCRRSTYGLGLLRILRPDFMLVSIFPLVPGECNLP